MTEWNKVKIDGISDNLKKTLDSMESDAINEVYIIPKIGLAIRYMVDLSRAKTREDEEWAARELGLYANWIKHYSDYIAQRALSDWEF